MMNVKKVRIAPESLNAGLASWPAFRISRYPLNPGGIASFPLFFHCLSAGDSLFFAPGQPIVMFKPLLFPHFSSFNATL